MHMSIMKITKIIAAWLIMSLWAGVACGGTVTYVYTDAQDTPIAEADADGNITARFYYMPYGAPVPNMGPAPDGPGYTGHVNDPDTGLVYMQARYYDPAVGRFLSVDPVGPSPGNTFNFNRYAYANNNPSKYIDPDGRYPDTEFGLGRMAQTVGGNSEAFGAAGPWAAGAALGLATMGSASSLQILRTLGSVIVRRAAECGAESSQKVAGIRIGKSPSQARAALEEAGYPGRAITNKGTTESGTLHNIPSKKMDVRVMDGGPHHGPRVSANVQGSRQPKPLDGGNFGNVSQREQRIGSHIYFDKK